MKVLLAEKPSVARDLAAALGATTRKQGCIEGGDWVVTWALGHLVELAEPETYRPEWKRWHLDSLPMLPESFQLQPRQDKGARDQLKIICDLFKCADELVCATDAGREGELIFRYICKWAKAENLPFQRLWLQSLTPDAIRKGLDTLRDGHELDPLYQAARCRSEADWIIGLNATRLTTVKYGSRTQLWSVGRVQTPVLALLAERDREIDQFTPETYWTLITLYRDTRFHQPKRKFSSEEEAEALKERLKPHPLEITSAEQKEKRVVQPQLYDLSSLQQDMNTWFGFTADQTLQVAQELYEAKHLTYPRTDSRHIGKAEAAELPGLLKALPQEYQGFVEKLTATPLRPGKRVVDDSKVTDHHAILPTMQPPRGLQGPSGKVYAAVVRRLLAALYPPCLQQVTTVHARVEEEKFLAKGSVITDPGWQELYPHLQKNKSTSGKEDDEPDQVMPVMEVGESGPHEPRVLTKTTQPPKRFTEAALLKRMETAGRLVQDDALRDAMRQRGLGTPATRAAIIETLLGRGYIRRQKKQLISTEAGRHLLTLVEDPALLSAELTGEWEAKLKEIEQGRGDPEEFMAGIREQARNMVQSKDNGLGPCPQCGAPVIEGNRGYGCSRWKEGCKFVLWREQPGLTLDLPRVRELLSLGHSLHPVPVKPEDGEPGLATLTLNKDGSLTFKPVKGKRAGKNQRTLGDCPECGGAVVSTRKGFACINREQGCPLFIWNTLAGKKMTDDLVQTLLTTGETDFLNDFTSRAGKPFTAKLCLIKGEVKMRFQ